VRLWAVPHSTMKTNRDGAMAKGRARYTESDVTRILKAAAKARVGVHVRIAIDGTIVITTGGPGEPNGDAANPWDELLHDPAEQKRSS